MNVLADRHEPKHALFAAALGADFYDQLVSATNDLDTSVKLGESSRAQRTAATQGITAQVSRGRQVLQVLNPIVKRGLAGNAQLLQDWDNRRRISGPSRTAASTPLLPGATTTTQPAATPAASPVSQTPSAVPPATGTSPAPGHSPSSAAGLTAAPIPAVSSTQAAAPSNPSAPSAPAGGPTPTG